MSYINQSLDNVFLSDLCTVLSSSPPFTIQRLAELLLNPTKHHSNLGKFLRAIEKILLVTTPWEPPSYNPSTSAPPTQPSRDDTMPPGSTTPMFSPIPFLARDHDLSTEAVMPNGRLEEGLMSPLVLENGFGGNMRSPTPEPEDAEMNGEEEPRTTATAGSVIGLMESQDPGHQPYLGRVDELDTGPVTSTGANGHMNGGEDGVGVGVGEGGNMTVHGMSDRPVPITSTTTAESERRIAALPRPRGLADRFVSGGTEGGDEVKAEDGTDPSDELHEEAKEEVKPA